MSLNFDLTKITDFRTTCYDTRTDPPPSGRSEEAAPCPECEGSCEIVGEGEARECVCFDCDHRHKTFRVFVDCSPNPWSTEPDAEGVYTRMTAVTYVLIWKSMALDLGTIEADNVDEWVLRLRLHGAFHGDDHGGDLITTDDDGNRTARPVTREEIEAHIGLTTNVATVKRPKWLTSMSQSHDRRRAWEGRAA